MEDCGETFHVKKTTAYGGSGEDDLVPRDSLSLFFPYLSGTLRTRLVYRPTEHDLTAVKQEKFAEVKQSTSKLRLSFSLF